MITRVYLQHREPWISDSVELFESTDEATKAARRWSTSEYYRRVVVVTTHECVAFSGGEQEGPTSS